MQKSPFEISIDTCKKELKEKKPLILEKFKNKKLKKTFYLKNDNFEKNNILNSNIIQIRVILTISYHEDSFEFYIPTATKKNKDTGEIEFNIRDIIETLFSNFEQDFISKYTLSYYINDDENNEINDNIKSNLNNNYKSYSFAGDNNSQDKQIKPYFYFGEINIDENNDLDNFFELPKDLTLYLNLRQRIFKSNPLECSLFSTDIDYNEICENIELEEEKEEDIINKKDNKGSGRDKEKTIGYSIKKLFKWQKIREKSNSKITLIEAAKLVRMPKKTLDEYKNQIMNGQKNGFNFSKHHNDKMNILRTFNNKFKQDEDNKNNS